MSVRSLKNSGVGRIPFNHCLCPGPVEFELRHWFMVHWYINGISSSLNATVLTQRFLCLAVDSVVSFTVGGRCQKKVLSRTYLNERETDEHAFIFQHNYRQRIAISEYSDACRIEKF